MSTTPEIPIDHLLLESEMVRRHGPALVTAPEDDARVYRPLIEASGLQSYVAAPLMPTGRVIGFLHADYECAVVDELDRDILWAFAEAFGHIFERAVLLRRLREQREQVPRGDADRRARARRARLRRDRARRPRRRTAARPARRAGSRPARRPPRAHGSTRC